MPSQIKVDEIKNVAGQYEIKTNTFKGQTTAGSIAVQGEGTATTNLQQGLCKVWVNYLTAATFVNNDSFNYASMTDEGAGLALHTFTNAMSNTFYSYVGMSNEVSAGASLTSKTTTTCRQYAYSGTPSAADTTENNMILAGDLA